MPASRRLLVFVAFVLLLQAQWAFAVHDHEAADGGSDACEICHHAQHGKVLPAAVVPLPASPRQAVPVPIAVRSVSHTFFSVLARGPPPALPL